MGSSGGKEPRERGDCKYKGPGVGMCSLFARQKGHCDQTRGSRGEAGDEAREMTGAGHVDPCNQGKGLQILISA